LKRLGGADFENSNGQKVRINSQSIGHNLAYSLGSKLEQFLQTFWVVPSADKQAGESTQLYAQPQHQDVSDVPMSLAESKAANIQKMIQLQNIAMERKLDNIARMVEDVEISLCQRAARRERLNRQVEQSQRRKIEALQRSHHEQEIADQKRQEHAQRGGNGRIEAARVESGQGQSWQIREQWNEGEGGQDEPKQCGRIHGEEQVECSQLTQREGNEAQRKGTLCVQPNGNQKVGMKRIQSEHGLCNQSKGVKAIQGRAGQKQQSQSKKVESMNVRSAVKAKESRPNKARIHNTANAKSMRKNDGETDTRYIASTSDMGQKKAKKPNTANTKQMRPKIKIEPSH
jgi:hypothetical protein